MSEPAFPFLNGPWRMSMGLRRLPPEDWIRIDADHDVQMQLRDRLLAEQREAVAAALPGSEAGCAEVLRMLADFLPGRFAERWHRVGGRLIDRLNGREVTLDHDQPLVSAGRLVQEDLCLMRKRPSGYELAAAVLCFPSHWRLADKLGRPMSAIHAPVPDFDARLQPTAERFMAGLDPGQPVWRMNWSIAETDELFLPGDRAQRMFDAEGEVGDRLFLRVERQTLRRLPQSGDILFTIHTWVRPLGVAITRAEDAAALAAQIRGMPDRMARYKGFHLTGVPLLAWLDQLAGGVLVRQPG